MSDDSTLTDSSDDKEIPAKKSKTDSKEQKTGASKKRAKVLSEGSSEDDGENTIEKLKGSGKILAKPSKSSLDSSGDEVEKDEIETKNALKRERDHQGNEIFPIGGNRFVSVDRFKGRLLFGIREYYQKDGKWNPGKKGISLNQDQYKTFLKVLPDVKKLMSSA